DRPDAGEVRLDGEVPRGPWPPARVMFQDGRLLPWLRVGANVELGLPPGPPGRAAELLAAVGLADRADDWPAVLSGGQRQRVALARALAAAPRLLLLDEPLGSLDALTRLEMQQLVEGLRRESKFTAVLVTHDVDEAVALADRIVLLKSGRVAGTWTIDLPRPRFRDNSQYSALAQQILSVVMATPSEQ
ncbi:ABC transporter ATP-binding protein, partial [bacterium]|nr:ABC transporter ATP-binding protein [bacterium]